MTVADALVASLQRLGVRYVFGLPGSTEGPLLDALSRVESPEYVLGLHENVVVAMADGYARVSGDVGVVSLHTSVGTGNAVSQIMNANVDRSPILAMVGHKDAGIANRDGFCTVEDLPGLLRPYTKWSRQVEVAERAVEDLQRAVQLAAAHPRGPVSLVITEDRASAAFTGSAPRVPPLPIANGFGPAREAIEATVRELETAQRPIIIAGDGVSWSDAGELLEQLASAFACPVLQEPRRSASRMNCSTTFDHYCGEYAPSHPAVVDADLVLAVGARVFVEFEPSTVSELPPAARFIHAHEDPTELGMRYVPDLGLVGTARETLQALLAASQEQGREADRDTMRVSRLRARYEAGVADQRAAAEGGVLTIAAASRVLDEGLADDVVLIDEGIRSSRILLQHLAIPSTRSYHRNTGGAIGWGLPAAVGAAFAAPERPVALFVGDGSALMTIQALWTAAHHHLHLTIFVSNNRGYQAVQAAVEKHREHRLPQPAVGAAIAGPEPDFVRLAQGFGVPAVAVDTPDELRAAMRKTEVTSGPMVIELRLAESEYVGSSR
jgi:benzoylformate decarboxylase